MVQPYEAKEHYLASLRVKQSHIWKRQCRAKSASEELRWKLYMSREREELNFVCVCYLLHSSGKPCRKWDSCWLGLSIRLWRATKCSAHLLCDFCPSTFPFWALRGSGFKWIRLNELVVLQTFISWPPISILIGGIITSLGKFGIIWTLTCNRRWCERKKERKSDSNPIGPAWMKSLLVIGMLSMPSRPHKIGLQLLPPLKGGFYTTTTSS